MNRKQEVAFDLMSIMKRIYNIHPLSAPSEKQQAMIDAMVDYLEANISLRRKSKEKDKECSTESKSLSETVN